MDQPPPNIRWLVVVGFFLVGAYAVLAACMFAFVVWVAVFDSEGGEPGAETLYSVFYFLPAVLVLALIAGVASVTNRNAQIVAAVLAVTASLGIYLVGVVNTGG